MFPIVEPRKIYPNLYGNRFPNYFMSIDFTKNSIVSMGSITPTFLRDSIAYRPSGQAVLTGEPRLGEDGGLLIEPETQNFLSPNQASVETDTSGFLLYRGTETISSSTEQAWIGNRSLKVITPGAENNEGIWTASVNVTPPATHAGSLHIYGDGGSFLLALEERASDDSYIGESSQVITPPAGVWTRYWVSRYFGSTGAKARLRLLTNTARATTFYIDGLQIEKKTVATSWMPGNQSRAIEYVRFQVFPLLPTDCTVCLVAKSKFNHSVVTSYNALLRSDPATNLNFQFDFTPTVPNRSLRGRIATTASNYIWPEGFLADTEYVSHFVYDKLSTASYINGEFVSSPAATNVSPFLRSRLEFRGVIGPVILKYFYIWPRILTPQEIKAHYQGAIIY